MKRRSLPLVLATAVVSLVVAGCGGDDEPATAVEGDSGATGPTAAAIPLDDWIDQADTICGEEGAVIDDAAAETLPRASSPMRLRWISSRRKR